MSEKVLITPAELSDMTKSESIVLIDTRDPSTYAAGHLPNAVNIHDIFTYLATSTPEGVATMRDKFAAIFGAAGLSGKETAVVYEQSMNSGFGQSCRGYADHRGASDGLLFQAGAQRRSRQDRRLGRRPRQDHQQ